MMLRVMLVLLFLAGSGAVAPEVTSQEIPGTYDMMICYGPCSFPDTANVAMRGRVVLHDRQVALTDIPEEWRAYFAQGAFEMYLEGQLNGAYALQCFPRNVSFAGITPIGLTHWSKIAGPDSVRFVLYRSGDGGYDVRGRIEGSVFRGVGYSWHCEGDSTWQSSPDSIIGRWIGPPDLRACYPGGRPWEQ